MITDPIRSVLDFSFYKEVPKKTPGQLIGYIAYLGLLYSLVVVLAMYIHMRPKIKEAVDWAATSIPEMTFSDGKLTSSARGTSIIRHPTFEDVVVIIDTDRTSAITPAEMSERKALAYLTQDKIYILDPSGVLKTHDLSQAKNDKPVDIDADFYQSIGSILSTIMYPVALISSWMIFLAWKHMAAIIYALLGILINAGVGGGMRFPDLYKLSIYAQTPVIILQMIALLALKPIPQFRILAFLLVGVYLWQAIGQHTPAEPQEAA